jgi:hypothetical protein
MKAFLACMAFGSVALAPGARCGEMVLPVERVVVIADEEANSRVLFGVGPLESLQREWITSARLEIPVPAMVPEGAMDLEVSNLTRAWDETAAWNTPWAAPGGDSEYVWATNLTLRAGVRADQIRLDVTEIVRAMASGDLANHGFVLKPADSERAGFDSTERSILGDLAGGVLRIRYHQLSALYRASREELNDRSGRPRPR